MEKWPGTKQPKQRQALNLDTAGPEVVSGAPPGCGLVTAVKV